MVQIAHVSIDVEPYLQRNEQPTVMLPRTEESTLAVFRSATSPVNKESIEWTPSSKGEHVRVPVFAYTVGGEVSDILAFMYSIGWLACASLEEKPIAIWLVIGQQIHALDDGSNRVYVGVSVRIL